MLHPHPPLTSIPRLKGQEPPETPALLEYLERYLRLGFVITPLLPRTKRPYDLDWNRRPRSPDELRRHFDQNTQHGMGLMHAQSGTLVLDVDNEGEARACLEAVGIDLDLLLEGPCIRSAKGIKPVFRLPRDLERQVRQGEKGMHPFSWPNPGGKGRYSVFELRAGHTQDVLPPSLHPSGVRYRWNGEAPGSRADIPLLEGKLLELYLNFSELKAVMERVCPWFKAPEIPVKALSSPRPAPRYGSPSAREVILAFNARFTLHELLLEAGYLPRGKNRYLMSGSTSGVPGVEVYPASGSKPERLFSKHSACPLMADTYRDAFETFKYLSHGGVQGHALDAARDILNMK